MQLSPQALEHLVQSWKRHQGQGFRALIGSSEDTNEELVLLVVLEFELRALHLQSLYHLSHISSRFC
jgi:hypothetical protein